MDKNYKKSFFIDFEVSHTPGF